MNNPEDDEIAALKARLAKLEAGNDGLGPAKSSPPKTTSPWPAILCTAVLVVGGLFAWSAREGAKARYETDELALRLAGLKGGSQTCNLAWLKAIDLEKDDRRTPGIHEPEILVDGPPRVMACEMIRAGGAAAEPLRVIERCSRVDMACVDLAP